MNGRMSPPRTADRVGLRPSDLRFRMPAEWEPHRATWLVWPHNRDDWEVKTAAVEWCYTEIVRHLVDGERVAILVQNPTVERRARRALRRTGVDLQHVEMYRIPTDRSWIRDSGPLFVVRDEPRGRREVAATDWSFNGWARYRRWQRDNDVPARIARHLEARRFAVRARVGRAVHPVVLEGGSIDVNGRGLLLTTEECLLSPVQARNPHLSRNDIERILGGTLGIRRVLWLHGGIVGDDTHGHVDDVARFAAPGTVLVATEQDRTDVNYEPLRANWRRLKSVKDLRGRPLRIVPLPMPRPVYFDDQRLPASYLNFYIGNGRVLVPTFNDPSDRIALNRLARVFPARQVVGIHAGDLILGLGSVHCLTQQEPSSHTT